MARLNDRRCHVIFMDSRAEGLQEKIDALNGGEYLGVRKCGGATLQQLISSANAHLKNYPFDVVYVAGGVCDITQKEHGTKRISFAWTSKEELTEHLISTLKRGNDFLTREHPAAKIVFCTLVGLELERVVNTHKVETHQQLMVDEAVFAFNDEIFAINKVRGTYSPSLHRSIHRSLRGVKRSYYHHLEDGIHLSDNQKDRWAAEMVKATANN